MSKGLSIIVGLLALVIVLISIPNVIPSASNQGYAPEQPIPFSHKLHAGDNKIACQYCHSDVERSKHASVPGVGVCMNCHSVVKVTSPLIQKVREAWEKKQPIEWVRVHELPDFAYFPHKRHVAAGVSCQTCHGPIETMEKVYQYGALTMGWCMECHRGRSTPRNVLEARAESIANHPQGLVAPVNCSTCHY